MGSRSSIERSQSRLQGEELELRFRELTLRVRIFDDARPREEQSFPSVEDTGAQRHVELPVTIAVEPPQRPRVPAPTEAFVGDDPLPGGLSWHAAHRGRGV